MQFNTSAICIFFSVWSACNFKRRREWHRYSFWLLSGIAGYNRKEAGLRVSFVCKLLHDNVITFLARCAGRGIHRSPGNSPHKGQWRGALMFSSICAWTNGWVNNRDVGDLRRNRAHYDVIVMVPVQCSLDIYGHFIVENSRKTPHSKTFEQFKTVGYNLSP